MNEIKVIEETPKNIIPQVESKTITEYLDATGLTAQLLPNEKTMFINMAREFGLNPFKREIYCTAYGEGKFRKCSIVTGYEVYIKRAERTGKLNGWKVEISGSLKDNTLAATITIYRKDWTYPFQHTAYYAECVQKNKEGKPNQVWDKQPIFMTKKVATAQGFRLCFSDEFGGMPYTNDELGVDMAKEINITPDTESKLPENVEKIAKAVHGEVVEETPAQKEPKGGRDTAEEHGKITQLLYAKYPDETPIFDKKDKSTIGYMRLEKTAAETIEWLENEKKIRLEHFESCQPSVNNGSDFPEDILF